MNNKTKNSYYNYIHNSNSNLNIKQKKLFQTKTENNIDAKSNLYKTNVHSNINTNTNIKTNKSQKNIFPKINYSKYNENKSIYKNKTFVEKLKEIYEGKVKYKYRTLNTENKKSGKNNMDMPELLEHKNIKLFKKNKNIFLSPLHYAKIEQMKEIKNKLVTEGLLDKEVFKIYNKNV